MHSSSTKARWVHIPDSTTSFSPGQSKAQIKLPLRHGGHGFTPIAALVHASFAASLVESAAIRASNAPHQTVQQYYKQARRSIKTFTNTLHPKFHREGVSMAEHKIVSLGQFEPQALAERPERTHKVLFQAYSDAAAHCY